MPINSILNFSFPKYLACAPPMFSESMTGTGWSSNMSTLSFFVQKGIGGGGDSGCTGGDTGCAGGDTGCPGGDTGCAGGGYRLRRR